MGVKEQAFFMPDDGPSGVQWRIYDLGGARNQRQAWAPFFEDG